MWGRKYSYETKDDATDNHEYLTAKFTSDLRKHIKRLSYCEIFSKEWFAMTDLISQVCKIAVLETKQNNQSIATSKNIFSKSQDLNKPTSNTAPTPTSSFTSSGTESPQQLPTPGSIAQKSMGIAPKRPKSRMGGLIIAGNNSSIGNGRNQTESQKKKKMDSTLWEKEEYCVRYLVEEGKVNLLLRFIHDFKQKQNDLLAGSLNKENILKSCGVDEDTLFSHIKKFEQNLGILIKCCLAAREAIHVCDSTHLLNHSSFTLNNALTAYQNPSKSELNQCQEFLVFVYLKYLLKYGTQSREEIICGTFLEKDLMSCCTKFLEKYYKDLSPEELLECSEMLSLLMDTEYYKTYREKFFPSDEDKKRLVKLNDYFINSLLTGYERKKLLRPLLDNITRMTL